MTLLGFRRTESGALLFALMTAVTMIAHQVAGKATRDALFLSHFDVTELPKAVIAAAILSMLAVLAMSSLLARWGPGKLVPAAFGISAGLFLGEWFLFGQASRLAAVVLYLHMAIFGAILISGFWSVINERFDPHTAKLKIARVAAAAALGGVLGGIIAQWVASLVDVRAMLLVLSVLHLACVFLIHAISPPRRSTPNEVAVRSGVQIITRTPYLQQMGLLMMLIALTAALVDYAFKAEASARFDSSESLITFFAGFYAAVGLLTFLVQSLLGPRMLHRFGIGTTIAVLPTMVLIGGMAGAVITHLWSMVLLRGAQTVFANSFFRSAFELLYTPLPLPQKRPTKTIIDVAADRFGDMLGGGLILLLLAFMTDLPGAVVVSLAMVAAGLALYLVTRLHHGYVGQLAKGLRKGAVSLDAGEVVDATTQHILAETNLYTERELLMARIKEHRISRGLEKPDETKAAPDELSEEAIEVIEEGVPGVIPHASHEPTRSELLAKAVSELTSKNVSRVRHALRDEFMDTQLAAFLIPLLGDDEVAEDARMELRWLVPRIIGQLTDALLDPAMPLVVRQRLPGVLEVCHNPRSIDGLLQGLDDYEFNVRYSCARALARMRTRNPDLVIRPEIVIEAVRREVDVESTLWEKRALVIDTSLPVDGPLPEPNLPKANRSLEHVFTMLSLWLDADALQLAFHAVYSRDRNLRGTALEYLENVLPDEIRLNLWRHIGITQAGEKTKRSRRAILSELRSKPLPR